MFHICRCIHVYICVFYIFIFYLLELNICWTKKYSEYYITTITETYIYFYKLRSLRCAWYKAHRIKCDLIREIMFIMRTHPKYVYISYAAFLFYARFISFDNGTLNKNIFRIYLRFPKISFVIRVFYHRCAIIVESMSRFPLARRRSHAILDQPRTKIHRGCPRAWMRGWMDFGTAGVCRYG